MLGDLVIDHCVASPGVHDNITVVTLHVPVTEGKDTLNRLRVLQPGAIIVGGDLTCTGRAGMGRAGALPALIKHLRERVVAEPSVRDAGSAAAEVTLQTAEAGLHECFEYSQLEMYKGCAAS